MRKIKRPFFLANPKSYLYGERCLKLAEAADEIAAETGIDVFFSCPDTDLRLIKENTSHVIVTAQHMDSLRPGRGQGRVLPEAVKEAGAEAVYLNHTEHPLTLEELYKTIVRAKELQLVSIVCANSVSEGVAIATMEPEIIVCEPSDLIGSGKVADDRYMKEAIARIHSANPTAMIVIGASISTGDDCVRVIHAGADGTGATSGIVNAKNPCAKVREMVQALAEYRDNTMDQ